MNLAQAMSSLQYAGRNPAWEEYLRAAPCEQRAMVERWKEILKEMIIDNPGEAGIAFARLDKAHRVANGFPAKPYPDRVIYLEDAMQGDWAQFRKEMGYSETDDASYR